MNHKSYLAGDRSYFSLIKKDIHKTVTSAGFDANKINEIDIIVSEVTSNLYKHANGGELLAKVENLPHNEYFELISIDYGPGITDISKVLSDGYSSTNTLGHGLGSIKRLSDEFDIYSLKSWGTVILSRVYKATSLTHLKNEPVFKALNIPKPGEQVSGDGYCFCKTGEGFKVLIADGLGHGTEAHHAASEACRAFRICTDNSPSETLRYIHNLIRKTRGAVATAVFYDASKKTWSISGVGNIAVRWNGGTSNRNYGGYNGIVGHNIPNSLSDQELAQEEFQQFIACSDGIRSRWDYSRLPLIQRHDPAVLAAAIYKEFGRRTDDTSVIICKVI